MFRHASAVVTNGGYTGVTLALSHGVPLLQAGTTEEKSEIGARIRWTGVGLALRTTAAEAGRGPDRGAAGPHRAVVTGPPPSGCGRRWRRTTPVARVPCCWSGWPRPVRR